MEAKTTTETGHVEVEPSEHDGTSDEVETEDEFLAASPKHTDGAALLWSGAADEHTHRHHHR